MRQNAVLCGNVLNVYPFPKQALVLTCRLYKSLLSMTEWCFTPLSTVFQLYHGDSSHYSCLSWVSPVLGWALKCLAQGYSHEKNPEDPVRREPRTPGLRVKHFTTEPRGTLNKSLENTAGKGEIAISPFPKVFSIRLENFLPFSSNFKLSSAKSFSLE